MDDIKIYKKIVFDKPVMLAGWPGMGQVALGTIEYLRKKLNAVKFAEIRIDMFTSPDSIVIDDGVARLPDVPRYVFYYAKDANLVIFEGQVQLPGQDGIKMLNIVIDMAAEFGVTRIYTGAALPLPISHTQESEVYGVVNKKILRPILAKAGVKIMDEGSVSGLNGLVLGYAGKRGIEALCFLATIPHYAISLPNPKASCAVIESLSQILGFSIDLKDLERDVAQMDEKMGIVEEKVKDVFVGNEEKREHSRQFDKTVPGPIVEKIEKLFREAHLDRKKATDLKKELDRWDLFQAYEDRFLDLFKENQ